MWQPVRFGTVLLVLLGISVAGCRGKFRRALLHRGKSHPHAASSQPGKPAKLTLNEAYLAGTPVDLGSFAGIRGRTLSAIAEAANAQTAPQDSLVSLARIWEEAPQSAVIAIELARVAAKARDERRLQRFIRIARPLIVEQPNLSKLLEKVGGKAALASAKPARPPSTRAVRLDGVADLKSVCSFITKSFAEGRPPVSDVGAQGTASVECQALSSYDLTPELQALPVVAAARGSGQRLFGWIAAKWRGSVWLSPSIVESFVPPFHPDGNGFSIDLQRVSAFRDGMPELSAYIRQHRTAIDPALNEKSELEQHELVVLTFDVEPPRVSAPVVLHSRFERSLVDTNDSALPKGYTHSTNLGNVTERSYKLKWGDNLAILTPLVPSDAKPIEQILFAD